MKKVIVGLAILFGLGLWMAIGLHAGAKRIVDISATLYDTVRNADTRAAEAKGMVPYPIITVNAAGGATSFDKVIFSCYVPNYAEAASSGAGNFNATYSTKVDSFFCGLYTGRDELTITLGRDTCVALPCTCEIMYDMEDFHDTAGMGTGGLRGNALGTRFGTEKYGLLMDKLWFEYRGADSAGAGDTMAAAIPYWIRLVEDK